MAVAFPPLTRWLCMVAGIYIEISFGISSTFIIYTTKLTSTLHYSQLNVNTISLIEDFGANLGIFAGFLYAAVIKAKNNAAQSGFARFGIYFLYVIGAFLCFIGYLMTWLVLNENIRCNKAFHYFFIFAATHSQSYVSTANIMLAITNFQENRGTAVAIIKGFSGLSGSILIQLDKSFFKSYPTGFVIVMAVFPLVATTFFVWLVRLKKVNSKEDGWFLSRFLICGIVIAVILFIVTVIDNTHRIGSLVQIITTAVVLILIAIPLGIGVINENQDKSNSSSSITQEHDGESFFESTASLRFFLLLSGTILSMGSAKALLHNINIIGVSVKLTDIEMQNLLSLWYTLSFFGCSLAGFCSDILLRKLHIGRPWLLFVAQLVVIIGHMVNQQTGFLFLGSGFVAFGFGAHSGLLHTIISDLFGVDVTPKLITSLNMATPVFSFLLSLAVIIQNYTHKTIHGGCKDKSCFASSHLLFALSSICGSLFTLGLGFATQANYKPKNLG